MIESQMEMFITVALLGGIFFLGIFHLIVYIVRRKLYTHLYFGSICILFVIWFTMTVYSFQVYPFNILSDDMKHTIAVMCTTQMILFVNLYTLNILEIKKDEYQRILKIITTTLLLGCFIMLFSPTYLLIFTFIVQLSNALLQIYLLFDVIKVAKYYLNNIRIVIIIFFISTCLTSVLEVFGIQFRDNTIYLATAMLLIQTIILAVHYNESIVKVEQANLVLEVKVQERTEELVLKEKETIELISSISHDLRTPVAVLNGYMELLQLDESISQTSQSYVDHSLLRLMQMEKLTFDLFTLSQINDRHFTLEIEEIDLQAIANQVVSMYEKQIRDKKLTLQVNVAHVICLADKTRIVQIFDNLILNALAYASTMIRIQTEQNDSFVAITIADDGEGIHPQELPYIFNRFYKKRQQGTGIGLSIVKDLVERMSGTIKVESIQYEGTDFTFTLPIKPNLKNS